MSELLPLPPLSHYLDVAEPDTTSTTKKVTTTNTSASTTLPKTSKRLKRSATLASRFKHTAEKPTSSPVRRSFSVSATTKRPSPVPAAAMPAPLRQDAHWDDTSPWEMYFDPNYTFFGGKVLDPRQRQRQQEVLKAMALHDHYLHLHPPPSAGASTAADQLQQPSLPYTVMDAVHHQQQQYASLLDLSQARGRLLPPLPNNNADDNEENPSPMSIQTMYYPAESPTHDVNEHDDVQDGHEHHIRTMSHQDHQARLALLQAIRTESYHPAPMHASNAALVKQQTTIATTPPQPASVVAATGGGQSAAKVSHQQHQNRRYRDPSRYIWMETPSPTKKEKAQSASTFDLASLQEAGQVPLTQKPNQATHHSSTRSDNERRYRTSFLYFVFGFVFPPVWVIGALYTPPDNQQSYQSSHGRRIDLMWKRACRLAFALFTFGLLVMVVIILALNPGALGWRTSRTDLNSAQQFIPVVAQ
ncbi:hypothetical protein BCR42DRAFT_473635 [Absidia repens]|uniref:Uncharacterized protein n=1 Tax=Absidia repens TaxID=90262 RepID=A0A1X2HZQ8_9FUNG|nr:hypothetical protein BCR42DRAFT_473635 [Absidia repens]